MSQNSHELPFVIRDEAGRLNFWAPARTGDWRLDNALGRHNADRIVDYIAASGDATALAAIARGAAANFDGVAAGFFARISERLAAAG